MSEAIEPGTVVVVYLGAPREQVFGLVLALNQAGLVVRGISIAVVDDWLRSFSTEGGVATSGLGMSTSFYPMHRIEKIALDESLGGVRPIHERFQERTGMSVREFVGFETRGTTLDDPEH